jgi:chaperone BCS1
MLEQIWTFLLQQAQTNQFLTGGFVLGAIASVIAVCKDVPRRMWTWVKCQFVIEVDIPDRDEAFLWVNKWLSLHPYGQKRARLLTVRTESANTDGSCTAKTLTSDDKLKANQPQIIFSPSAGVHWFWYKGRFVVLTRDRKDQEGKTDSGAVSSGIRESFIIKVFTRNREIVKQLLEDARELVHPKGEVRIGILTCGRYSTNWSCTAKRRPRPTESVILKAGVMESLIENISKFLTSEQWYIDRGIPWRYGILLKGPPGSGKSSLATALASHFGLDIAILTLGGNRLDDEGLRDLLSDVPKNTIVLIEDIDCIYDQREVKDDDCKVTFSGLLNAIDGVAAGEGRILMMTTNHPEKLDPALIRPGRADLRVDIGWPDAGQISRMFERFFPGTTPTQNLRFIEALPTTQVSMAALQAHLSKYSDAEEAIRTAQEAIVAPEKAIAQQ